MNIDFNNEKKVIMLIGLPLSGKTYFSENQIQISLMRDSKRFIVFSSNDILKLISKALYVSRSDIYSNVKKYIDFAMESHAKDFFLKHQQTNFPVINTVIWDEYNTTKKERINKIKLIPDDWTKIAIFVPEASDDDFSERKKRAKLDGTFISDKHYFDMKKKMDYPDEEEGFNKVYRISNFEL